MDYDKKMICMIIRYHHKENKDSILEPHYDGFMSAGAATFDDFDLACENYNRNNPHMRPMIADEPFSDIDPHTLCSYTIKQLSRNEFSNLYDHMDARYHKSYKK